MTDGSHVGPNKSNGGHKVFTCFNILVQHLRDGLTKNFQSSISHTHIHAHTHAHTHMHTHIHTYTHSYLFTYLGERESVCVCVCACVRMRVCVCVCLRSLLNSAIGVDAIVFAADWLSCPLLNHSLSISQVSE